MALSTDYIPLSRSLQERVEEQFAPDDRSEPRNPLSREDICSYLAKSKDTDGSPLATIRRRASKDNRSPDVTPKHHAALAWVADAFSEWEDQYALETPLRDQVRRLLPLAVAMAISDDAFFTPGAHPLHQLLDAIQSGAVGWQVRLDRAGQMLEQRVERSIDKALEWFNNERVDISAITRELVGANERDVARAQRMVQRLEETEQARLKTLTAKRDAAELINGGLAQYHLPSAIGEFVKGAWYDSAQMVLVKFGNDSREWEQMSRATLHLMQSVQPLDDSSNADRDRQSQILRHLPGQLRRWLISLEHDSDATDSAIGLVEYAHLRIQHGQVLDLAQIPLIPVEELGGGPETSPDEFKNGEWYQFEDDQGELRAQLVLQLERGHHLLFTNFVGLKALDLSRLVFSQRLSDGFAMALPNCDTFSLSLAAAAGIDSNDKLKKFLDPSYEPEPVKELEPDPEPEIKTPDLSGEQVFELDLDLDDGAADAAEESATDTETAPEGLDTSLGGGAVDPSSSQTGSAEAGSPTEEPSASGFNESASDRSDDSNSLTDPLEPAQSNTGAAPDYDPVLAPPEGAEIYEDSAPAMGSETSPSISVTSAESGAPSSPSGASGARSPQGPSLSPPIAPGSQGNPEAPVDEATSPTTPQTGGSESQIARASDYAAPTANPAQPTAPTAPAATPTTPQASSETPPPSAVTPAGEETPPADSPVQPVDREIEVPMGAWLGFHDGETPIMAKLAVYDPRRDNYIFVNRKGIAMRELSKDELLVLMDRGLVDILETRNYFRDEVERARGEDS
ncbi:MAG: DUF1631 family protein [Pseudomonadota bacterium]